MGHGAVLLVCGCVHPECCAPAGIVDLTKRLDAKHVPASQYTLGSLAWLAYRVLEWGS